MTKRKYFYEQYWSDRTGEMKERALTQKQIATDNYDISQVSTSYDSPQVRKQKRELYEVGRLGIGRRTGGEFSDTVNWGKMGGRPTKWKSEAERKKVSRIKQKVRQNKPLKEREQKVISDLNITTASWNSNYSPSNPRPGSYQYHTDRPASSTERVRRHRDSII